MKQQFGGDWTERKLKCIQDYLEAYVRILSKNKYRFAYIDACSPTIDSTELCVMKYVDPPSKISGIEINNIKVTNNFVFILLNLNIFSPLYLYV